ncbi:MAG: hypothetical protein J6I38_06870 [Prevotella sp.]|nr:hypothetical protein [Prevotella sp.]
MKDYLKQCINFKVNVWRSLVAFVFFGSILTGCVDSTDNPVDPGQETATGDDASDKMPFKVTQVSVNDNGKSTKTVALRYYEDMPHVAYIAVADFQDMLLAGTSIRVSKTAVSQYSLTTSHGKTATVNTAEESMTFDDFLNFVALGVTTTGESDDDDDDEPSFVLRTKETLTPATAALSLNMKKYGIDLRGDGRMVYVPLSTLSDMYSNLYSNHVMFNGEKIIVTNFEKTPAEIDAAFFKKPYQTEERPEDLAAYSYGELCFAIDHFYGRPGRNSIDKTIEADGIDKALGENVRKLLKSTDMEEYIFGMEILATKLADGSHTLISPILNGTLGGLFEQKSVESLVDKFITPFGQLYPLEALGIVNALAKRDGSDESAAKRKSVLKSDTYAKVGNTMYCIYDDFGPIDTEGWAAFYQGKGQIPTYNPNFKGDICGIVEALDKAAADPEVKNFVLDLTCNSGGEASVLAAITTLLAGKNSFAFENVLTKQRGVDEFEVDGNFDRVFDDKDKAPRHPELNIAILTSRFAYSCGNLLPSLMKDYGYLIIGEKSGGGSCSIQKMCTPEGLCYQLSSSRTRLINKAGENIDKGVEPHIALEVKMVKVKDADGDNIEYPDFSAFYDKSVGDKIVEWYANKK